MDALVVLEVGQLAEALAARGALDVEEAQGKNLSAPVHRWLWCLP